MSLDQRLNDMPLYIDSHAHLNLINEKIDDTISKCKEAGVNYIVNVGYDLSSSEFSINLANNHKPVFGSIGIHPHYVDSVQINEIENIFKRIIYNRKIIAIGEIGLDYVKSTTPKSKQFELLDYQLNLVLTYNLPVIIHNRSADNDILSILDNYKNLRGVFHCFSSNKEFAKKVLDKGFYISFTGNITYPNSQQLQDVVSWVPLDSILLETDSPYLSPQILRGKENHPVNVKHIYETVAIIKNIDIEELSQSIFNNFINLFLKGKEEVIIDG
ncbi:MAG: TatD family hydrolase [Caldisericia bacterium]|nr:TatD family hydrolase [Caldisericia bacterium]